MATQHLQHHRGGSSTAAGAGGSNIDDAIGIDLLHNIISRLPATSFASAACVNRSWNSICSRILSYPKLSSAISLNPSLEEAVNEVVEKVLSVPIRPQFVIASIGPSFTLPRAHQLITARFGSGVPVITSLSDGIIGRDALTSEFKEVQWELMEDDEDLDGHGNLLPNQGIVLTVGHLPDMRATMIPLLSQDEEPLMIDEFVMDIREYASLVSGSTSPAAIILFSDLKTDMRPVLQKFDYTFSFETVVVGEGGGRYFYRSDWDKNTTMKQDGNPAVVALLFVKDRHKPPGIGETKFHATLSTGLHPVGAVYKAASVREEKNERSTWLTARREATSVHLDGQSILDNVYNEIGDRIQHLALYIGVNKRRKCSIGLKKARWMMFLEFHEVIGGDEEYLYVNDLGIRTGDSFRFYVSDSDATLSSNTNVTEYFRRLKHEYDHMSNQQDSGSVANTNKKSVFGGLIFACCGRGTSFFGRCNVDSAPFLENFPGATLGGTFCSGEIKLANKSIYGQEQESEDQGYVRCTLHFFSTTYLVLSYIPA
ncbi:F-box/LRR-repeat protein At5g63520-like [Coffea arabica]|uniref:F-box/LRR-repeat protein At5g63520-like n=1 Tax=Coffea arabica TaxID=13443 RepID=A0A6P6TE58_COFAR